MTATHLRACAHVNRLRRECGRDEFIRRLAPIAENPPQMIPSGARDREGTLEKRWDILSARPEIREILLDDKTLGEKDRYRQNIENFIGCIRLPVGLAGPLRMNGVFAKGDYYIPLATTEAALVACHSRGARLISEAGGCAAILLDEGICRSPGFVFYSVKEAGLFIDWALSQMNAFRQEAEATTRYGKLTEMRTTFEGNHVYLDFEFTTGDAAGQNMATIATEAICEYINTHSPVRPRYCFVEANSSGDKKANAQSFARVRGKKVIAEVFLPPQLIEERLRTTPEKMVEYWRMAAIGGVLSGTVGVQGHYANGLAALFIACGQDAACVAESAVGITRLEIAPLGELYASVTLPNLVVGTVGGGTGLPTQNACLEIMGLAGPGKARALAEVCAGLCLSGELSIIGAICSGEFARAHRHLARGFRTRKKQEMAPHV